AARGTYRQGKGRGRAGGGEGEGGRRRRPDEARAEPGVRRSRQDRVRVDLCRRPDRFTARSERGEDSRAPGEDRRGKFTGRLTPSSWRSFSGCCHGLLDVE